MGIADTTVRIIVHTTDIAHTTVMAMGIVRITALTPIMDTAIITAHTVTATAIVTTAGHTVTGKR